MKILLAFRDQKEPVFPFFRFFEFVAMDQLTPQQIQMLIQQQRLGLLKSPFPNKSSSFNSFNLNQIPPQVNTQLPNQNHLFNTNQMSQIPPISIQMNQVLPSQINALPQIMTNQINNQPQIVANQPQIMTNQINNQPQIIPNYSRNNPVLVNNRYKAIAPAFASAPQQSTRCFFANQMHGLIDNSYTLMNSNTLNKKIEPKTPTITNFPDLPNQVPIGSKRKIKDLLSELDPNETLDAMTEDVIILITSVYCNVLIILLKM
jgi:hypothetical protein